MSAHPYFRFFWVTARVVLAAAVLMLLAGVVWDYSTQRYLQGFADAVVPFAGDEEHKVEAILAWMEHGPARRTATNADELPQRDPSTTLNYQELLRVCGTATNAFVNLAASGGLEARRLLLLSPDDSSKHVVAEVLIQGRWVVVDPSFHRLFRDAQGRPVTRQQMKDMEIWRQATAVVPNYPQTFTYERTVHLRLARIPWVGKHLRLLLDRVVPGWEEGFDWTLLVERESRAFAFFAAALVLLAAALRAALSWYGRRRLGIHRVRLRDQLRQAGRLLLQQSR